MLVTGNITTTPNTTSAQAIFKNCAPFKDCRTEINDTFVDYSDFINITMPMYNFIEYSDSYFDTSGSLWDFKRDEIDNNATVTNDDNAHSFKYKANLIGNIKANGIRNGVKTDVTLKYLSNFWRSLEIPLINCKIELSLKWVENFMLTTATTATFTKTDAKLYVPIVTLSSKLFSERFKGPIYWNEYKVIPNKIIESAVVDGEKYIRELLDSSYQGVKRLFVLAYNNTAGNDQVSIDDYKKSFLPRVKTENYNIDIDGRYFYDQPINGSIKQYNEIRKISTGKGDYYTTACLLDFAYFENKL